MEIKLIRDLTTERNKEQEDIFENTMNLDLYFSLNKSIDKVDGWNFSNIKKLVSSLNDEISLSIFYSKWNKNIEYIYKNLNFEHSLNFNDLSQDIKNSFAEGDILVIHETIKNSKENPNMKLSILLLMAEIISDEQTIEIINYVINGGILTLQMAIEMLLPKLLERNKNE